jgi:hypothetical protein
MGTAKAFLGLSEKRFWRTSPRTLMSMIDQWKRVQRSLSGLSPDPDEEEGAGESEPQSALDRFWASWDSL